MGSPCKLLRLSGALSLGLGGFRSATAGGSTGVSSHCLAPQKARDLGTQDACKPKGQRRDLG